MRFSEASGRVLTAASREARRLGQPAVGTGHLLRALLLEEACSASELLRGAGVEAMRLLASLDSRVHDFATEGPFGTPEAAIDERRIEALVRSGRVVRLAHDPDRLPQTAALKRAIEATIEEARRIGPSREPLPGEAGFADVGTEHMLLGLLTVGDAVAGKVLERTGIDAMRVRERIPAGLSVSAQERPTQPWTSTRAEASQTQPDGNDVVRKSLAPLHRNNAGP